MIVIVYGLCFIFTFLVPFAIFLRRMKMLPWLWDLENLVSEPQYDKDNNVLSIDNNFKEFSGNMGKSIHHNYFFKILSRICADVKDGNRYEPSFYLMLYRKYQYRFLGNIFLASHIAPVLFLLLRQFNFHNMFGVVLFLRLNTGNMFGVLLFLQFIWYVLIIAGQRLLSGKYDLFTEMFYCGWYNKLLNFDMLSINALKKNLFSMTYFVTPDEINNILMETRNAFREPVELLLSSSQKLYSALETFTNDIRKFDLVTVESIIGSIEEKIKSFEELCEHLNKTTLQSEESYTYLLNFVDKSTIDINAINTLANEFSDLRKTLAGYTVTAETTAIEKLSNVTNTLEVNINKTFTAIEETLITNTVELSKSYNYFFELCKKLVEDQEKENN